MLPKWQNEARKVSNSSYLFSLMSWITFHRKRVVNHSFYMFTLLKPNGNSFYRSFGILFHFLYADCGFRYCLHCFSVYAMQRLDWMIQETIYITWHLPREREMCKEYNSRIMTRMQFTNQIIIYAAAVYITEQSYTIASYSGIICKSFERDTTLVYAYDWVDMTSWRILKNAIYTCVQ